MAQADVRSVKERCMCKQPNLEARRACSSAYIYLKIQFVKIRRIYIGYNFEC